MMHVSPADIPTGRGDRSGLRGFTLIEILVVVAIIALLISILLPSLARVRELSRRTVCATRLHNIGLANQLYSASNKGKIIQCMMSGDPNETNTASAKFPNYTQVCLAPRMLAPGTSVSPGSEYLSYQYMDWFKIAKRYLLDHDTWECPNRPGIFGYEGNPTVATQGYTAADLRSQKYNVNSTVSYQQWMLGYQYFGGIAAWDMTWFNAKIYANPPSPKDFNRARPQWALASDSNIRGNLGWGTDRPSLFANTPPHPDADGGPAGGNVLFCDSSVSWIHRSRWVPYSYWHDAVNGRRVYFYQGELGEYGRTGKPTRGMPK